MRVRVKLQDLLGTHLGLLYLSPAEPGDLSQLYRWLSELGTIISPQNNHMKAEFGLLADFFGSSNAQKHFSPLLEENKLA